MLGRYEIISEIRPSPMSDSVNDSATRKVPSGRSKPRVSTDEPLVAKASASGRIPAAQKMAVYPPITAATQATGRLNRPIGA